MKIGSAVLGVHVAVLCAFSLTQGCVTTESDTPSRGAQHKGPFAHVHKGKEPAAMMASADDQMGFEDDLGAAPMYPVEPIDVTPFETSSTPMPNVATETYIVRKGDTLSQLAVDFDTTTAELVRLNGLANPDVLYVGQELAVPAGRGSASSASSSSSKPSVKKGGTYTIQKGDTLSEIAIAAGVSIDDLRALNNIEGDMIMAGETLDIPAGGKVPTTTKTSSPKKSEPKTAPQVEEPVPETADLALPAIAPATDETDVPAATTTSSIGVVEERVLYPGETLDDIAREYGLTKAEIMRLNNITDESQVKDGQRLRIPISE